MLTWRDTVQLHVHVRVVFWSRIPQSDPRCKQKLINNILFPESFVYRSHCKPIGRCRG